MIVLTDIVKASGKNNPMVIVLKSKAFEGYEITQLHNHFGVTLGYDITDGTVVITVPEIAGLQAGARLVAVWKLSVSIHLVYWAGWQAGERVVGFLSLKAAVSWLHVPCVAESTTGHMC